MEPWDQLDGLFDETWFLDCPSEVTNQRVLQRHIDNGFPEAKALAKVEFNDSLNAQLVNNSIRNADLVIDMNIPYQAQS